MSDAHLVALEGHLGLEPAGKLLVELVAQNSRLEVLADGLYAIHERVGLGQGGVGRLSRPDGDTVAAKLVQSQRG